MHRPTRLENVSHDADMGDRGSCQIGQSLLDKLKNPPAILSDSGSSSSKAACSNDLLLKTL